MKRYLALVQPIVPQLFPVQAWDTIYHFNERRKMKNYTNLIKLFKSGNFSIIYTDNGCCSVYKGTIDTNSNFEKETAVYEFDCENDGYLPKEVELLAWALHEFSLWLRE
tara:strand:- start:163 stop:489 length:327 start_codon:yes stop_codon:yes gene_type:complete